MPFNAYKTVSSVVQEFQVGYTEAHWVMETPIPVSDYFRNELTLVLTEGAVDNSEYAVCEKFIYPILKEVWKPYRQHLLLWSHPVLNYDQNLSGIPDYVVAKRSLLGRVVFERPFFVVVEAKRDDFEAGWGQCLAEMIAIQKINEAMDQTVFGIVSNGKSWEFGQLQAQRFVKEIITYSLTELDRLFAALNYLFQQCQLQLGEES